MKMKHRKNPIRQIMTTSRLASGTSCVLCRIAPASMCRPLRSLILGRGEAALTQETNEEEASPHSRSRNGPRERKNLIDWPKNKCFHCRGDHTRDACSSFKKMMEYANKGNSNKKTWKPPAGYKNAIGKARDAFQAAAQKKKKTGKVSCLRDDSDDTAPEDEL